MHFCNHRNQGVLCYSVIETGEQDAFSVFIEDMDMSEKNDNSNERLEERFGDEINTGNDEEDRKETANTVSKAIIVLVFLLFIIIIFFTDTIERYFGRAAGTGALIVIAGVIAALLYRKEIADYFRRGKKKDGENDKK